MTDNKKLMKECRDGIINLLLTIHRDMPNTAYNFGKKSGLRIAIDVCYETADISEARYKLTDMLVNVIGNFDGSAEMQGKKDGLRSAITLLGEPMEQFNVGGAASGGFSMVEMIVESILSLGSITKAEAKQLIGAVIATVGGNVRK